MSRHAANKSPHQILRKRRRRPSSGDTLQPQYWHAKNVRKPIIFGFLDCSIVDEQVFRADETHSHFMNGSCQVTKALLQPFPRLYFYHQYRRYRWQVLKKSISFVPIGVAYFGHFTMIDWPTPAGIDVYRRRFTYERLARARLFIIAAWSSQ